MNKAFVREPDDTGQRHCPRCQSLSVTLRRETYLEHLQPEAAERLADVAYFCPFPSCDVVYFDDYERLALVSELKHPVYPKDLDAPMCACFGLTRDDIEDEVRAGSVQRIREVVLKAKTPEAHCHTASPSGQPCVGEVQRYYMKLRGGGS
jgi:hypothetical protein